jgi:hypothetical protein
LKPPLIYENITAAIEAEGFTPRGGLHPDPEDVVPDAADGVRCRTLILIGNAGPGMWRAFQSAPEFRLADNPLNAFSRRVVEGLAARFGARPLFPFTGPPYLPFLAWAAKAESVWPSPIGPLIHAEYGLWHAYRGALAFSQRIALPAMPQAQRPCDTCAERPCLTSCPVGAFSADGYDVPACVAHIDTPEGQDCIEGGCLARRACPVGRDYLYAPAQAELHMTAFLRSAKGR